MTKLEFEKRIKEFKVQKVNFESDIQKRVSKLKELYLDKRNCDLYGCFFDEESREFVIFFIDSERGMMRDFGSYKTEEEAYEKLFIRINKWENQM